ncbi:hypothetical protein [Amycolatopsis solani]|uniref:hypothetical protein n=1 Tax=Amycolatopsis solani TaxID=3028615 RepID=UPI0025B101AE|nr:hypothetical protein [Amycolatopsis sp. MEP2-6]
MITEHLAVAENIARRLSKWSIDVPVSAAAADDGLTIADQLADDETGYARSTSSLKARSPGGSVSRSSRDAAAVECGPPAFGATVRRTRGRALPTW